MRLGRLADDNGRRRRLASRYTETLAGLGQLLTPIEADWAEAVYHLYVVRSPDRDGLQERLRSRGIETLIHYPIACHRQPAFASLGLRAGDFPVAERLAAEVLSLPLWPSMGEAMVDRVVRSVAAGV